MNLKIKIFSATNIKKLEQDISEWFKTANISMILNSHLNTTINETNKNFNTYTKNEQQQQYIYTFIYEEKLEK